MNVSRRLRVASNPEGMCELFWSEGSALPVGDDRKLHTWAPCKRCINSFGGHPKKCGVHPQRTRSALRRLLIIEFIGMSQIRN